MSASTHARGGPPVGEMPEELSPRHLGRRLLELAVLIGVVAALISALPGLGDLRNRFAHANGIYVALIGAAEIGSLLSYVLVFREVFCRRMSWRFGYQLGMAEQATNVLLPTGGAGGLALGAWALRQGGMSTNYIARRSVAMFVITSIPNFASCAVLGLLLVARVLPGQVPVVVTAVFAALAIAAMALAASLPRFHARARPHEGGGRIRRAWERIAAALADGVSDTRTVLRGRPLAICGAIGYLGFDVLALSAAFAAFGGGLPVGPLVFAYVIGQLGGLIPVPAGIGGTDGGLIGALVLYGSPLSQAAAAVLAYRAFQLGLPALLGAIAFVQLRRTLRTAAAPAELCTPLAEPITT